MNKDSKKCTYCFCLVQNPCDNYFDNCTTDLGQQKTNLSLDGVRKSIYDTIKITTIK